jgi:hypothetical protein
MKVDIMTSQYDTWISEEQLWSLNNDELTWFKDECGLSHEDLFRILLRAKKIARELRPNDDLLELTFDTGGAWYIRAERSDTKGWWNICVRRADLSMRRQQAEGR